MRFSFRGRQLNERLWASALFVPAQSFAAVLAYGTFSWAGIVLRCLLFAAWSATAMWGVRTLYSAAPRRALLAPFVVLAPILMVVALLGMFGIHID